MGCTSQFSLPNLKATLTTVSAHLTCKRACNAAIVGAAQETRIQSNRTHRPTKALNILNLQGIKVAAHPPRSKHGKTYTLNAPVVFGRTPVPYILQLGSAPSQCASHGKGSPRASGFIAMRAGEYPTIRTVVSPARRIDPLRHIAGIKTSTRWCFSSHSRGLVMGIAIVGVHLQLRQRSSRMKMSTSRTEP